MEPVENITKNILKGISRHENTFFSRWRAMRWQHLKRGSLCPAPSTILCTRLSTAHSVSVDIRPEREEYKIYILDFVEWVHADLPNCTKPKQ